MIYPPEHTALHLVHTSWNKVVHFNGREGPGCLLLAYCENKFVRIYWAGWETIEQFNWVSGNTYKYCTPGSQPDVFVAIISHVKNHEQRKACRDTWLTHLPRDVQYRFYVGGKDQPKDALYGDVVQLYDCPDDYYFLPTKVVAIMEHARQAYNWTWFCKCDDDTYLEGSRLPTILKPDRFIVGDLTNSTDYCMGGCYFMKRCVVDSILEQQGALIDRGPEDAIIVSAGIHGGFPITNVHGKIYQGRPSGASTATDDSIVALHPMKPAEAMYEEYAKWEAKHAKTGRDS